MKKAVKWVLIGLFIIAAAAGTAYYLSLPLNVAALEVVPETAEIYFIEQGIAETQKSVNIYPAISGMLKSVEVTENERVNEGDIICTVDTADFEFQIEQSRGSILTYEAQIANLDIEQQKARDTMQANRTALLGEYNTLTAQEASSGTNAQKQNDAKQSQIRLQNIIIEQTENELKRAEDELQKAEVLYSSGVIAESDYLQAQKAVTAANNLLIQNRQQLDVISQGEAEADEAYYNAAKAALEEQIRVLDENLAANYTGGMKKYYETLIDGANVTIKQLEQKIETAAVRANVSGVITELFVSGTNFVSQQTPAAAITPDTSALVEVYVSTNDIDEIAAGLNVDLILKRRAGDKTFTGKIIEIDNEATVKISALGTQERRVKVTVKPETGTEEIKKGFDVDVKFNTYFEENKLIVPKTAVFTVDGKDMVWVIKSGTAEMAEITKGRELRAGFVAEGGIAAGDVVIIDANNEGLRGGARAKKISG
ncbi:MAG: HlyD family secretion protein [Clostridiales bacterium]|jgi:HlyD family secretion protein|nr:HlyD family secretion protein [Clostridiales bacterium]